MTIRTLLAAVLVALALPAAAGAHPGVYQVVAKIAKTAAEQTITVNATGGTFKPSAGATPVAWNATADEVRDALRADPAIGYDNVAVSEPSAGQYAVTFIGSLAGTAVAALAPDTSGLTGGTASVHVDSPGGAAVTYASDPTGATMADQVQYIVSSDGYALGYRETNGVAGGGLLNLKELPTTYRKDMRPAQKLAFPLAQTGLQLHATCSGVPELSEPANILAFDLTGRTDGDPFFDYLPWQKTSAGFGDDPSHWIPVVKSATNGLPGAPAGGVDLSTLNTVQDFTSACAALGGTYHPADTASNVTNAVVADAVAAATGPLNAQIGTLTAQVGSMVPQLATLTSENTMLKAGGAAPARDLQLTLASRHIGARGITAMLTGPTGQAATLRVRLSTAAAKALHLKSRTIATKTKKLDGQGAALIVVSATKTATRALGKVKGSLPVTIAATAGAHTVSRTATLKD